MRPCTRWLPSASRTLFRRISADGGGAKYTTNYGYDTADNLTTLTGGATQSFDAANQLCWQSPSGATSTCAAPADATTYGYDIRGNGTSVGPTGGPTTTLGYDQANRLTAYGSGATYSYNGTGLRMAKIVNGTTTNQTWGHAQGLPLPLVDGTTSYVYGPGGLPLEQVTSTYTLYYHHDQLGSNRVLTDATTAGCAGPGGAVSPSLAARWRPRLPPRGILRACSSETQPSTGDFAVRRTERPETRNPPPANWEVQSAREPESHCLAPSESPPGCTYQMAASGVATTTSSGTDASVRPQHDGARLQPRWPR